MEPGALRDIWPSEREIQAAMLSSIDAAVFRQQLQRVRGQ